jgi:hypothetical protein
MIRIDFAALVARKIQDSAAIGREQYQQGAGTAGLSEV